MCLNANRVFLYCSLHFVAERASTTPSPSSVHPFPDCLLPHLSDLLGLHSFEAFTGLQTNQQRAALLPRCSSWSNVTDQITPDTHHGLILKSPDAQEYKGSGQNGEIANIVMCVS